MSAGALAGRRILVTRPHERSESLCSGIREAGGEAVVIPAIGIERLPDSAELDAAIARLGSYDWLVCTSGNAVESFFSRLETVGSAAKRSMGRTKVAAIGPATARSLSERGVPVDVLPEEELSSSLAAALGDLRGLRVLLPCSAIARKELGEALRERGALVDELRVYDTLPAILDESARAELERGFDAVLFASPSAARNFAAMIGGPARLGGALVACIGPVTAEEAESCGYRVGLVATSHSAEGLIQALAGYFLDGA